MIDRKPKSRCDVCGKGRRSDPPSANVNPCLACRHWANSYVTFLNYKRRVMGFILSRPVFEISRPWPNYVFTLYEKYLLDKAPR